MKARADRKPCLLSSHHPGRAQVCSGGSVCACPPLEGCKRRRCLEGHGVMQTNDNNNCSGTVSVGWMWGLVLGRDFAPCPPPSVMNWVKIMKFMRVGGGEHRWVGWGAQGSIGTAHANKDREHLGEGGRVRTSSGGQQSTERSCGKNERPTWDHAGDGVDGSLYLRAVLSVVNCQNKVAMV